MARWVKFTVIQVCCPSFKALFTPNLVQKRKKRRLWEKTSMESIRNMKKKKKNGESPGGVERHALPNRSSEM